jgi:TolB-like protein
MPLKKKLCLFLFWVSLPLFAGGGKYNIAVSDLAGQGIEQSSTAIISDRLRTELFKQGGFNVLERNAMQDILKEQGFQQSGCTSDACAVEIGQLLGVSYIVVGTVGKLGHLFTIDVRMIEVGTGKIAYSENVDCDCPIEKVLTNSVVSIAKKITENVKISAISTSQTKPNEQKSPSLDALAQDTAKPAPGRMEPSKNMAAGPKPKKSPVLKITFGAVALAAAGAGYAFDYMLKGKIDDNARLTAEYKAQPGNSQYAEYSGKIADNNKSANTNQTLRNASYIVAGLGLAGFVITFLF